MKTRISDSFFEHQGKRYTRFDKIEVEGCEVRFFWRGELLMTQLLTSSNEVPNLKIEGIQVVDRMSVSDRCETEGFKGGCERMHPGKTHDEYVVDRQLEQDRRIYGASYHMKVDGKKIRIHPECVTIQNTESENEVHNDREESR